MVTPPNASRVGAWRTPLARDKPTDTNRCHECRYGPDTLTARASDCPHLFRTGTSQAMWPLQSDDGSRAALDLCEPFPLSAQSGATVSKIQGRHIVAGADRHAPRRENTGCGDVQDVNPADANNPVEPAVCLNELSLSATCQTWYRGS